jgi:nitroreductase
MNVIEAIEKRRSIRRYKPDEIPEDVLDRLLNVLRLAPSGSNRQPWKFIVVRDKEMRVRVAAACGTQRWIGEAPVIIVACGSRRAAAAIYYEDQKLCVATGQVVIEERGKKPDEYVSSLEWDLAIALDHLTLAAVDEGLGTCWIGLVNEPELKQCLSIPNDLTAQLVMPIGYPVSWPEAGQRKPLEEIICYDRYG